MWNANIFAALWTTRMFFFFLYSSATRLNLIMIWDSNQSSLLGEHILMTWTLWHMKAARKLTSMINRSSKSTCFSSNFKPHDACQIMNIHICSLYLFVRWVNCPSLPQSRRRVILILQWRRGEWSAAEWGSVRQSGLRGGGRHWGQKEDHVVSCPGELIVSLPSLPSAPSLWTNRDHCCWSPSTLAALCHFHLNACLCNLGTQQDYLVALEFTHHEMLENVHVVAVKLLISINRTGFLL